MAAPTDFGPEFYSAPAESAFASVVLAAVVAGLIVAAICSVCTWVWRSRVEARRREQAVDKIFLRILRLATLALSAGNHEITAAARNLRDAIDLHLGPALAFGKGAGESIKALDQALSGKKEVEKKAEPEPKPSCGCGPLKPCACGTGAAASASNAASLATPVIVNVLGGTPVMPAAAGAVHADPPAAVQPETPPAKTATPNAAKTTVDMSADEQIHALARSVREFHAWWNQPRVRKAELLAIVEALTTPPPPGALGEGRHRNWASEVRNGREHGHGL